MMPNNRLDDMLNRYGEVCTQKTAAKILSVVPRTIARMMKEGRLRRIGRGVDVRLIVAYIENPGKVNFTVAAQRKVSKRASLSEGAFLAASRTGKWSSTG